MNKPADPIKKAVALFYDGVNAPHVSAKGTGDIAEAIMEVATEHGVPLCDNPELVNLLMQLELDEEIPETLYIAVAYIIAFAYELDGNQPAGWKPGEKSAPDASATDA